MVERVNGYQIITPWTNAGGGMGKWAFAQKGGKEYFIKQFLRPTYPLPDGPGSPATKARKRTQCATFERHHRDLVGALKGLASEGGHLIVTRDFFREGAKYYKVTDRIETSGLSIEEIGAIRPTKNQVILALSLVHSIAILHRQGIVHGDLKPPNILPKRSSADLLVAKLIDFDDSYKAGHPPAGDEVVGDFAYYSPELLRYVRGEAEPRELGLPSDIFALALVLAQYFSGTLPEIAGASEPGGSIALGVQRGDRLITHLEVDWPDVDELLRAMLSLDPADRPTIEQVNARLVAIRNLESRGARRTARKDLGHGTAAPSSGEGVRLRGKGLTIGASGTRTTTVKPKDPDPTTTATPGLRGTLTRRSPRT